LIGSASTLAEEAASREWGLHGSHEFVTLGAPAAGAALTVTVPGSVEWEVLAVSFLYTADANAANRFPSLSILDQSGSGIGPICTPFKLVATDASRITFGVGIVQFGADSAAQIGCGIPPMRIQDGLRIRLTATNIQATDTIAAARLYVRQWRVRE